LREKEATASEIGDEATACWDQEIARFLVDEINSLFDRLQDREDPAFAKHKCDALARIALFRTAGPWWSASLDGFFRGFLRERRHLMPEDAFGAAVLLFCGSASREERDTILGTLTPVVRHTLAELGLCERENREGSL